MKTALIAILSSVALAQVDVNAFCSTRPLGLYCSPDSLFQKIECPSGKIFTCPKGSAEICQERGILKTSGFKGGIARCVPNLGNGTVAAFCSDKPQSGTYCFGDVDQNIYIQCPLGLIFKCADNSTATTKKCFQSGSRFATCELNNGGVGTGTPTPVCTASTVTVTETRTRIKRTRSFATVTSTICPLVGHSTTAVSSLPVTSTTAITTTTAVSTIPTVSVRTVTETLPVLNSPTVIIITDTFTEIETRTEVLPTTTGTFIGVGTGTPTLIIPGTTTTATTESTMTTETTMTSETTTTFETTTTTTESTLTETTPTFTPTTTTAVTTIPTVSIRTVTETLPLETATPTVIVITRTDILTETKTETLLGTTLANTVTPVGTGTPTVIVVTETITPTAAPTVILVTDTLTEIETRTEVLPSTTQTGTFIGVGTGTPTLIIPGEPTSTTATMTTTINAVGTGTPTLINPTPTPTPASNNGCPNGQQPIIAPPGSNFTYTFTSVKLTQSEAQSACQALGGALAWLGSASEHWWVGQQICDLVWYKNWEGNAFSDACIALFPGGASAVPVGGCQQSLLALCKVPV